MNESLFTLPSDVYAVTSDDCYTPRWVFDAMGLDRRTPSCRRSLRRSALRKDGGMKTALVAALILAGFAVGIAEATDVVPCWRCELSAVTR